MSIEERLFKLLTEKDSYGINYVEEMGWVSDNEFCIWVSYVWFDDFMKQLKEIFGYGMFDDGGFDANMQYDCVCIDLCKAIGYSVDLEELFPKEEYQH